MNIKRARVPSLQGTGNYTAFLQRERVFGFKWLLYKNLQTAKFIKKILN